MLARFIHKPIYDINKSQIELVNSYYLHYDMAPQCYDVRERTIKSGTDNLVIMYWDRKGSVTTTSSTASILCQQALWQLHHRYLTLKDYIPSPANKMAVNASQLQHMSDRRFLAIVL